MRQTKAWPAALLSLLVGAALTRATPGASERCVGTERPGLRPRRAGAKSMADAKMSALRDQLAFYFSDANLRKDRYLLQLTGPRGTGEVRIRELSSFNRVKALVGDDLEAVCTALRQVPALEVSDDGEHVWRTRELSAYDDSDERTVYVEPLRAGTSRDALQDVFGGFGEVTYISLPRLPSGDLKGFAFVEFALPDAAVAASASSALDESMGACLAGAGTPLRVMHKRAWLAMKEEYKRALDQGRREADAQASSMAAAAEAEAAAAAAAAEEAAQRRVVKVMGLPKGGTAVKAIRREMREAFGRVAPLEFVDYGISNSGDVTIAYVRMATPVGAAEAVRVLSAEGQRFLIAPLHCMLIASLITCRCACSRRRGSASMGTRSASSYCTARRSARTPR